MLLHSLSYGSGHSLIILHGLLGSSDNWHSLGKMFGASFNTLIPDARNHGRSPHSNVFNYEAMAGDVKDLMDHEHIPSTYLVGHSMGGKTAMLFALTYPDRVDKLVVVDIAPRWYDDEYSRIFRVMKSIDLISMTERKMIDAALAAQIPDLPVRQLLMKNLTWDEHGNFQWTVNLEIIHEFYHELMKEIKSTRQFSKPTLFIRGGLSNSVTPEDESYMKILFPEMSIATVPGAGHWVHADAPAEFARIALKFLHE